MEKAGNARLINLVMLALLVAGIWVAYQRISLVLKYRAQKKEKPEAFTAHIIDEKKVGLIKHARQLSEKSELLSHLTSEEKEKIAEITKQITSMEQEYIAPASPAMVLLGPIGTANIVLKEQSLERDIVIQLNQLNLILHQHFAQEHTKPFQPAENLQDAIKQIEHMLKHRGA